MYREKKSRRTHPQTETMFNSEDGVMGTFLSASYPLTFFESYF